MTDAKSRVRIKPPSNVVKVGVILNSFHSVRRLNRLRMEKYQNWLESLDQNKLDFIYELTRIPKQDILKKTVVYILHDNKDIVGVFVAKRILAELIESCGLSELTISTWRIDSDVLIDSCSASNWVSNYRLQYPKR